MSRIASRYSRPVVGFDREDLVSVGMAEVVKAACLDLPRLSAERSLAQKRAYLVCAARHEIISEYRDGYADPLRRPVQANQSRIASLDAPFGDSDLSLYDVLAFVDPVLSGESNFAPLYDAIALLPEIYRVAVCMRFGLCGYGVHRNCEIASLLWISQSAVYSRIQRGLELLRGRKELRAMVGLEEEQDGYVEDEEEEQEVPGEKDRPVFVQSSVEVQG